MEPDLPAQKTTPASHAAPTGASPEWRAAQHRVRNDMQTLGALWRLAHRRVSSDTLATVFPSWLNAMAALYDALPLWQPLSRIPVESLLTALRSRCSQTASFDVEVRGEPALPAQTAMIGTLGISSLLEYGARSVGPQGSVQVIATGEERLVRIEISYIAVPNPPTWPPLGLTLAAEAAATECATGLDGDRTVAVLVIPCR